MNDANEAFASRRQPKRSSTGGRILAVGVAVAVLLGLAAVGLGVGRAWQHGTRSAVRTAEVAASSAISPTPGVKAISISATGDIIMGNAPDHLPARDGKGFFDSVEPALAADLVMGNLEEPLTDDTGNAKCAWDSSDCYQFRAPPSYAAHLRDAGFTVLNQANNHGYDYGQAGYRNTQKALEKYGLRHTGAPGEITMVKLDSVWVAVVGFSSYAWSNSVVDIPAAREVVKRAGRLADLVVVQVHMGAEGADKTHVRPGTEMFLGEDRGDPIVFSHAMIDAGADLVVGHGPHVMRALEFYKGRLIAYSLGNFAGGAGTLSNNGRLGLGAVLRVSLRIDGSWAGGEFVSTYMNASGVPTLDDRKRGLAMVRSLCEADFPTTGARFDTDGTILPPTR